MIDLNAMAKTVRGMSRDLEANMNHSAKKAYYWNCNCGCINIAPALQTADKVVVCDKCRKEFKWCKVRTPKPI